jgi:hypothetical protein
MDAGIPIAAVHDIAERMEGRLRNEFPNSAASLFIPNRSIPEAGGTGIPKAATDCTDFTDFHPEENLIRDLRRPEGPPER